ncbi:MAG: HAD family hydrolase [Nitrososphaerota archaeon]|nr:HAD family hydrolase [Nitrososphaerota archaeon]
MVISFDIGNTLLKLKDSKGFCSYFCDVTGLNMDYLRPLFFEHFLTKNNALEYAVAEVCRIVNYKQVDEIVNGYIPPNVDAYHDAISTLRSLSERGFSLIAVSNCTPWEAYGLNETGLKKYINKVYYSHLLGVAKPDIKVFQYVQNDIGVPAEHIMHVGDSLEADVIGASAAGWSSILLDRNSKSSFRENDGHCVINSLSSLVNLFTELF